MARKTAKPEVAAADPDGRSKMDAVEVADEETGSNRWIAHVNKYGTIPPDFRQMPRWHSFIHSDDPDGVS